MINWFALFTILSTGFLVAVQITSNAQFGKSLGLPLFTVVFSFVQLLCGIVVLAVTVLLQKWGLFDAVVPVSYSKIPFFQWIGGLLGVFILIGISYSVPKLGPLPSMIGFLGGQLLMCLVIERFGFFSVVKQEIDTARIVGVSLVLIGLFLTIKPRN